VRSWRKVYPEVVAASGQLMVVVQSALSTHSYVSKKLAPNFPIVFDHHEHVASHFHVGGHGNSLFSGDEIVLILVDSDGRLALTFDGLPQPKNVLTTCVGWKADVKKLRSEKRRVVKRNGSDSDSDSGENAAPH